jgi:neutral amino acid transport system substrate-binding protein
MDRSHASSGASASVTTEREISMIKSLRGRATFTLVGVTALAVALAGCSSTASTGSSPTAKPSTSTVSADPKAADCAASDDAATTFKLGTFLPLTGSLSFLGPGAVSGAGLALSEINKDGGVLGKPACTVDTDSSDTDNPTIGNSSIAKLLQAKVSAILGAESSGVTENVLSKVTASPGTVMISPANTDDKLTGISKWYYRTAPNNSVEANALGSQIVADGHTKVGILVFNDPYGTNLRDATEAYLTKNGASVTYGAKGKGQEFPSTQTTFSSDVTGVLASKPDAIVIDAFNQTEAIIKALASAGWTMKNTYFVDGNLADYSKDLAKGTLTGAQGTTQGVNPNAAFKAKLDAWYQKNEGKKLTTYSYAAESYDAVMLLALSADAAKSATSAAIQPKMLATSGASGGTVCKTYAACLPLANAGTAFHYTGPSSIGPFNKGHDPSSGYIGIYKYNSTNNYDFVSSVKG